MHERLLLQVAISLSLLVRFSPTRLRQLPTQVLQQAPQKAAVYGLVESAATGVSVTVDGGSAMASYTVAATVTSGAWKGARVPHSSLSHSCPRTN